jgi:hypothetical protein
LTKTSLILCQNRPYSKNVAKKPEYLSAFAENIF